MIERKHDHKICEILCIIALVNLVASIIYQQPLLSAISALPLLLTYVTHHE